MPDLTGQTLAQAQATLAAAGLQTGALLGSTEGIFVSASVQGADAPAGSQFKRGSAIDMTFLPPA
jgi:beta-lactam-binding protein with PASTA domain